MDNGELDTIANKYFIKGLADSTHKAYKSAQKRYLAFCMAERALAMPVSEEVLCKFVSKLAHERLRHTTIKSYLSGVRYMAIAEGGGDPFGQPLPRLQYTLKGIKRCEAEKGVKSKERLPISPGILTKIKAVWDSASSDPDVVMLWAACCLGFFCFLRAGEMTVPDHGRYDPAVHLSKGDVAVDDPEAPTMLRVHIKQSKTDPFRQGIHLFVGSTSSELCPVAAVLNYLIVRGSGDGPLFLFRDGRYLTRQRLVVAVRQALERAGIDQSKYCGHSFRIGAATTAASRGVEDAVIKTLGRWKSLAYLEYVKIPRDQLASYSARLC